jgi:arylsulfatase A
VEQERQVIETIPLDQVISRSTEESIRFIEDRTKASEPFFLYLALGSPHTPIVPSDEWVGKSGIGTYGDFVMETDNATVQVLNTLDRLGIAGNTLIFFTADNGCSPEAKIPELLEKRPRPAPHPARHEVRCMGRRPPRALRRPLAGSD